MASDGSAAQTTIGPRGGAGHRPAHRMRRVRTVHVHRLLAKDSIDERIVGVQQGKRLLFDEFARRSDAKKADRRAVDAGWHRPAVLDERSGPEANRDPPGERDPVHEVDLVAGSCAFANGRNR
jgi:hypothetical protein